MTRPDDPAFPNPQPIGEILEDDLVDRIRLATWVGDDRGSPDVIERHRASIARLVRVVRMQRAAGLSDEAIQRRAIELTLDRLDPDGVPEDSSQAETRVARAARSIDAALKLIPRTQEGLE